MEQLSRKPSNHGAFSEDVRKPMRHTASDEDSHQFSGHTEYGQNDLTASILPPFMMNVNDIQIEQLHTEAVWRKYRERQRAFEVKQAIHGGNADPAVMMEVEDINRHMKEFRERWQQLSELLENMANEEIQVIEQTSY